MAANPDRKALLTIANPQAGISDSPVMGWSLLKNVEIDTVAGAARATKKPISAFHVTLTKTFTAVAATDIMTISSGLNSNNIITGTAVTVSNSGGALPGGLSASTNYFVIRLSDTTFKLATTIANANAGTAIDLTDAGSGTNTVATIDPGTIRHQVRDTRTGTIFAQDSNGVVWYDNGGNGRFLLLNGNTLTNSSGNGLVLLRTSDGSATYLFAFRNAVVDVVNVFGTSQIQAPSWANGWQNLNTTAGNSNSHHSILGQNGIVYFCDAQFVGSIKENAGSVFDPTSSGTYTYSSQALDFPSDKLTYWLAELDINLLVSISNDDKVYPWDRSSDSYGLPIPIGEYGGNKMVNIGNIVYILMGTRGNIYWTQGTYARLLKKLPRYLTYSASQATSGPVTWGGIASVDGKLAVGVGAQSGQSGVYVFDVQGSILGAQPGAFTVDNYPSTGQAAATSLLAINDYYRMGYAGGADYFDGTLYTNLEAVLQSGLYRIGNHTQPTKISQLEVIIASPVVGSIRLDYRGNDTGSFINIPSPTGSTTTFVTDGVATSFQIDCGLINLVNFQLQVSYDHAIDIIEIRAWP